MNKNEIDIKLNLLEVIKELPSIIAENVYVTVGFISNRFNVNHIEATYILNSFIIESANIDDKYILYFQIEKQCNGIISCDIISSYNESLSSLLDDPNVLSFNLFAICQKKKDFLMTDFSAIASEIEMIQRYDLGKTEEIPEPVIEHKPKTQNFDTKSNIIDVNADENYYGGYKPKRIHEKPKKEEKVSKPIERSASKPKVEAPKEDKMEIEEEIVEPRKVKKIRKVKKTNTYMNEKGYMVTQDEWVDEEYYSDEKEKPITKRHNNGIQQPSQPKKAKKVAQGQSSLLSFFK